MGLSRYRVGDTRVNALRQTGIKKGRRGHKAKMKGSNQLYWRSEEIFQGFVPLVPSKGTGTKASDVAWAMSTARGQMSGDCITFMQWAIVQM